MTSHPAANCDPLGRFRSSRASAWLHVPNIAGGPLRRAGLIVTHLAIDACCARCQHGINDVLGIERSSNGQARGSPKMELHSAGSSHSSGWLQKRQRWGRVLGADRILLTGRNHRVTALKPMSASSLNRLGGTSGGLAPVSDDLRGEVMLSIRRVLSNVVTPDLRWVLVAWTKGQGGSKQVVASYQPATSAGEG